MKLLLSSFLVIVTLIGCKGPKGDSGQQGNQGQNGVTGAVGSQGAEGIQGDQGTAGSDGTLVVPVKFCSQVSVYPSTFPEYGLCINGHLYAVYSANDGFLALIPDGTYQSNAIGSACTFSVHGCEVQNE